MARGFLREHGQVQVDPDPTPGEAALYGWGRGGSPPASSGTPPIQIQEAARPCAGPRRRKDLCGLRPSQGARARILRQKGLARPRRKKHQRQNDLRAIQALYPPCARWPADTKALYDLPAYWPQRQPHPLPRYQYTVREVRSGALLLDDADERSPTYATLAKFTDTSCSVGDSIIKEVSGNVGIGLTSPGKKLDVSGDIRASASYLWNGNATVPSDATATIFNQAYVGPTVSGFSFEVRTGSTTMGARLRVDYAGNVGIGTASPTNLLSFGGNSTRTVWMERHTTSNTAGNALTLQAGGATSGATDKNGGNLILASGIATGSGSSQIQFQTATAGSTGTSDRSPSTKMVIDGAGSVILGATATKQSSGGPELISAQGSDQDKVVLWSGLTGDDNARFLFSYRGFLEWGPGTGTPNDQDIALFRNGPGGISIENFYSSGSGTTSPKAFRVSMPQEAGQPEGLELFAVDTENKAMRVARGESGFSGSESFRIVRAVDTTTSTTTNTLHSITLATNRAYYIVVRVVGRETNGNDRAFFQRAACVYRQTGGAVIESNTVLDFGTVKSNTSWNCTIDVDPINVNCS